MPDHCVTERITINRLRRLRDDDTRRRRRRRRRWFSFCQTVQWKTTGGNSSLLANMNTSHHVYGVYWKCVSGLIFFVLEFSNSNVSFSLTNTRIGYVEVDPCPTRQQTGVIRRRTASRIRVSIGADTADISR